jgi:hypothetical protein
MMCAFPVRCDSTGHYGKCPELDHNDDIVRVKSRFGKGFWVRKSGNPGVFA